MKNAGFVYTGFYHEKTQFSDCFKLQTRAIGDVWMDIGAANSIIGVRAIYLIFPFIHFL